VTSGLVNIKSLEGDVIVAIEKMYDIIWGFVRILGNIKEALGGVHKNKGAMPLRYTIQTNWIPA